MNPTLVRAVGTYGGPGAVISLIQWYAIRTLAKLPATPEQRQKRFLVLAYTNLIVAILSFGFLFLTHLNLPITINSNNKTSASSTTTNTTSGPLSPVIPNNCGSVTISGSSNHSEAAYTK